NRFDTERLGSDEPYDVDSEEESDESPEPERTSSTRQRKSKPRSRRAQPEWKEDEDSDEEEFEERVRTQPRKAPRAAKGKEDSRAKKEVKSEEKEFDELVEQMKKLAVSDPQYGLLFLKACSMKPMAADCLPRPQVNQSVPDRFEPRRMLPPHMARPDPNRFLSHRPQGPVSSGCFGCGESGHIMGECPRIQEFLEKRQVLRDYRGRFTTPDGMIVRRGPDENWVQAFKRSVVDVHFVTFGSRLDEISNDDDEESANVMVYPVERSQRETRSYRKQVFDRGPSPYQDKGKQKEYTPSQKPSQPMTRFPMQRLTPVETQPQTFNPDKDVEMMEDRTQPPRQKKANPAPVGDHTRVPAKASQISKNVDPTSVLDKILDSPVTLSVREVVGVSKDVASCLQDVLKVKKAELATAPVSNLVTSKTSSLIRLEMECNQKPVSFIVDTGSQLNIISEKVCKNIVRRPINMDEAISMNDANGGSGRLLGLVEDIPWKIGHVKTPISAYVAENPPFDGLLGRPWQRAHKIGIEERDDGTYLTF
ncbi:hypothetical protein FKP32DRAFT_1555612, partial [Trametes sanguinea]